MSSAKQYNLQPHKVINEASLSASKTSEITEIFNKDNIIYQCIWGGTLAGTFDVQVSSDYVSTPTPAGTWDSLPLSPVPTASGSPDSWTIDLNQLGAKYIKIVFNRSGGSGSLKVYISGKGI